MAGRPHEFRVVVVGDGVDGNVESVDADWVRRTLVLITVVCAHAEFTGRHKGEPGEHFVGHQLAKLRLRPASMKRRLRFAGGYFVRPRCAGRAILKARAKT
jgi:hypothetical protein